MWFSAILSGEPIGFILLQVALDEAEILTFAVRPAFSGQGFARALLSQAEEELQNEVSIVSFLRLPLRTPAHSTCTRNPASKRLVDEPVTTRAKKVCKTPS